MYGPLAMKLRAFFLLLAVSLTDCAYVAINAGGLTLADPSAPAFYGAWSFGDSPLYRANASYYSVPAKLAFRQDAFYSGHSCTVISHGHVAVQGTRDQALYRTERVGRSVFYEVNVPEGEYAVQLYFAELDPAFASKGARTFDVLLQGEVVVPALDIFTEAGGLNTAYILEKTAAVGPNQLLQIALKAKTGLAKINALYIRPTNTPPTPPPPPPLAPPPTEVAINVGNSTAFETQTKGTFRGDAFYLGGLADPSLELGGGGGEAGLFRGGRSGKSFEYVLNLKEGDYRVDLYMGEPPGGGGEGGPGKRVMDVYLNEVKVIANLDLFVLTGGVNIPVIVSRAATVANKLLRVKVLGRVGEAVLFALRVAPLGAKTAAYAAVNVGSAGDVLAPTGVVFKRDDVAGGGSFIARPPAIDPFALFSSEETDQLVSDQLYTSLRYGAADLTVPLPNGDYVIDLHFAGVSNATPGKRVFDVLLNGAPALTLLDLAKETGGALFHPVVLQAPVTVISGTLTLTLRPGPSTVDPPFISAFFVHPDIPGHSYTAAFDPAPTTTPSPTTPTPTPVIALPPAVAPAPVTTPPAITQAPPKGAAVTDGPGDKLPCPANGGPPRAVNCTGSCPAFSGGAVNIAVLAGGSASYTSSCGVTFIADDTQCDQSNAVPAGKPYCRTNIKGPDGGYSYRLPSSQPICDTADAPVFRNERIGFNTYKFRVPKGRYSVNAYFAEISGDDNPLVNVNEPGLRVMFMLFNGAGLDSPDREGPVDPFKDAGNRKFCANPVRMHVASVQDGVLSVQLFPVGLRDAPKLSAIWVYGPLAN